MALAQFLIRNGRLSETIDPISLQCGTSIEAAQGPFSLNPSNASSSFAAPNQSQPRSNSEINTPTTLRPLEGLVARTNHVLSEVLLVDDESLVTTAQRRWVPTTICHEDVRNVFDHYSHNQDNGLAPFQLAYSLTPLVVDDKLAWSLIRGALKAQHDWDVQDLPRVRLKISQPKKRRSSHPLVQCKDARTHQKMKDDASSMAVDKVVNGKVIRYKLRLEESGPCFCPEVFVTRFELMNSKGDVYEPVPHQVACRVANAFAQKCGAKETANYPHVKNGILGLYREQMQGVMSDGRQVHSDNDRWLLALSLPAHVDRSHIQAYHTDRLSGGKYRFVFQDSDMYCKTCGNNTVHEEVDCPNWNARIESSNLHFKLEDVDL